MFNRHDPSRNACMLTGPFAIKGYDWWWHSFTAVHAVTGEEKAFFVEFFLCNPRLARTTPTFGQLPKNRERGIRPSYLMVKAGCWGENACQLHRFFPWTEVKLHPAAPFSIEAGDCSCTDTQLHGRVQVSPEEAQSHPEWMSDAGEIRFDLKMEKQIAFNVGYGASRFLRRIKAFEMYWHAEGMQTRYVGSVTLNGEKYLVRPESCFGYADKNWGRNFTSPWVWLSSGCLTSNLTGERLENTVFDIGGGRPKIYMIPLHGKLLGGFMYKGREYEYNFSKPWTGAKTRFRCETTQEQVLWHVTLENKSSVMEIEACCSKRDMLLVRYESPDGRMRHKQLWNGGNGQAQVKLYEKQGKNRVLLDDLTATHLGCEYGVYSE